MLEHEPHLHDFIKWSWGVERLILFCVHADMLYNLTNFYWVFFVHSLQLGNPDLFITLIQLFFFFKINFLTKFEPTTQIGQWGLHQQHRLLMLAKIGTLTTVKMLSVCDVFFKHGYILFQFIFVDPWLSKTISNFMEESATLWYL